MYLNHHEIEALIAADCMLNCDPSCINAASLDLRVGNTILVENARDLTNGGKVYPVDYRKREKLQMTEFELDEGGVYIHPGVFFLAHTIEVCNFPDDLAALFRIKSSMGRIGLEHLDAGWVDPGFHGALTLEFKNMTENHSILLRPGDKIGQLVFMRGNPVPAELSYRTKGNYCGHTGVAQVGYKPAAEPATEKDGS